MAPKRRKAIRDARSDSSTVVGEWPHSKGEIVRVAVGTYNGHPFVGMRRWYRDIDGNLQPSRKGISFRPEDLKAARKALRAAARLLKKRPSAS